MAHPLKKSGRNREEPKLGEPKLVESDSKPDVTIAQQLQGESVADTLIRARQQLGQDLRSIADVLCIRYSYLDAIERAQYENLPGATYAVGFVRTYAEYLGLDGEKIVERFKGEVEGLDSQTKLHFPTPAPEGKMPGGAVFLVAALLFAGAYGVWYYLSNKDRDVADLVAPVPETLQQLAEDAPAAASAQPEADTPAAVDDGTAADTGGGTTEGATSGVQVPPAEDASSSPAASAERSAPQPTSEAPDAADDLAQQSAVPDTPAAGAPPAPSASPQSSFPAVEAEAVPADRTQPDATQTGAAETGSPQTDVPQSQADGPQADGPQVDGAQAEGSQPSDQAAVPSEPAQSGTAPSGSYAIPVAPDNGGTATAFLTNHEPQVYGEENVDARVVLKANQDAWVQVRDRQGNLLLTRVLRIGDSYRVPNQADLTMLTGNAGGLEITVDGRPLAPLGPVGAVRRDVPLDPEALRGGAGRQP